MSLYLRILYNLYTFLTFFPVKSTYKNGRAARPFQFAVIIWKMFPFSQVK